MSNTVNVQIVTADDETPAETALGDWAVKAMLAGGGEGEINVRVVGLEEGRSLNERWRRARGATNVLAFPIDVPEVIPRPYGDVVICAPVANAEAQRGGDFRQAHWAHLVIHGTLHLLGYDHQNAADAEKMEAVERTLMHELGYPDPYL